MNAQSPTLVLVVGLGESGLAMARWCARQGARLRVADSRAQPPGLQVLREAVPGAEVLAGPQAFADLEGLLAGVDRVLVSPGVDPRGGVIAEARRRAIPVGGEMGLFAAALQQLGARETCRILAITGTNGKTTTTALAAALCCAAGEDAVAAGNISPAPLDVLMQRLDQGARLPGVWVLELSSFQLETPHGLAPDAAVVLNLSDDHQDRYDGLDDYAAAKAAIYQGARVAVVNREDGRVAAMAPGALSFGCDAPPRARDYGLDAQGRLCQGPEVLLAASELRLAGRHNAANALAALALCEAIGLPRAALLDGLRAFRGLPHRVECVARRADGVLFYDDSKGTNVGATLAALCGAPRPVVLIAGGDGKGQDFTPLAPALRQHCRALLVIGRDGPAIAATVAGSGLPVVSCATLEEAVVQAAALAQAGDWVLLSPACASLDMFRNYAHRAEVFIAAARALPGVEAA